MASFDITISLETSRYSVSVQEVRRVTEKILSCLGWKKAELLIRLVSDRKIHGMNKKFLNHDEPTDVITFSGTEKLFPGMPLSGDIIISLDTTKRQAADYKNDFMYELYFYIAHGILHLLGHQDNSQIKRKLMLQKQAAILRKLAIRQR